MNHEAIIMEFFKGGIFAILEKDRRPEFAVISKDVKSSIKRNENYHQSITGDDDYLFGIPVIVVGGTYEYGIRYR